MFLNEQAAHGNRPQSGIAQTKTSLAIASRAGEGRAGPIQKEKMVRLS